jgi:hypothetical protein
MPTSGGVVEKPEMIIIDDCDDENTGQCKVRYYPLSRVEGALIVAGQSSVTHDSLGRLPGWARHQLDEGLKKIFRVHMIR